MHATAWSDTFVSQVGPDWVLLFPVFSFFWVECLPKSLDVDQFAQERVTAQAEQTSQFETSELPTGICIPSVEMVNGSDQTDVSNSADAL